MPEQTQNITNIPAPRVPFIDPRTNLISREWYRFFLNLFTLTGSGQSGSNTVVTTTEQQLGPMFTDLSGDFENVYSQGQIISMMSAFESQCAEIAQELHTLPPIQPSTGGGGLVYWTEGVDTNAPNDTVPATYFIPNNATTNVDAVINPKGLGALLANVPDGTATGGDKRGTNAVDLQTSRYDATCVASGNYATIVGGYGNVAANDYAFVGGGDSNTVIGIRAVITGGVGNVVNGDFSVIGGGYYNSIPGVESAFIGGGNGNAASGVGSTVAGGESNGATVKYCFVGGGYKNSANGEYSAIVGGKEGNARGLYGAEVFSAGGFSGTVGSAQRGIYVARVISSNATPIAITFDGNAISTTNQVVLSNNSTFFFKISLVARRADAADESAAYTIEGVIDRQASAATTAFVGTPVKTIFAEDNTAWDVSVSADTTNGALTITVTGETGKTIRWVAKIETVEVTN